MLGNGFDGADTVVVGLHTTHIGVSCTKGCSPHCTSRDLEIK